MDISNQKKVSLSIIPSKGTINVTVNKWNDRNKEWIISDGTEVIITVTHTLSDLNTDTKYKVYINNKLYNSYRSNSNGIIIFGYSGNLSNAQIFSVSDK